MKSILLSLCLLCIVTVHGFGQDKTMGTGMAVGFQVTQHQKDFGVGLHLTSPRFVYDKIAIRLKGNLMWFQHLTTENEMTWSPYFNFSIGLASISGRVGEHIRLYAEGGLVVLLPSDEFSEQSIDLGGYGLFGFELFFDPHGNYFIEFGGVGTGAKADKTFGNYIYSNGFLTNVGYRYQF
ncbi:MAG: hypothetical protein AAFY91_04025 [Bacteroidota bacterium]